MVERELWVKQDDLPCSAKGSSSVTSTPYQMLHDSYLPEIFMTLGNREMSGWSSDGSSSHIMDNILCPVISSC